MLIYDNEYKTKQMKIEPRIKVNYNMYILKRVGQYYAVQGDSNF